MLVLVCMAIGAVALFRPTRPASFVVLGQPVKKPVLFRDRVARFIPASWGWMWQVEQAVFGQRKPVNLFAEVVEIADSSSPLLSGVLPEPPSFSGSNGLEVWLLEAERLRALHEQLNQIPGTIRLSRPRISTADGIEGWLFQGSSIVLNGTTNQVGLAFGCCARVCRDATDLTACFTLSELVTNSAVGLGESSPVISVQTNLDTALRLHIAKGSGVFLLNGSCVDKQRKRIGILLDPPQPKA